MKKMMTGLAAVVLFSSCTQVGGWFGSNEDSTQLNIDSATYMAFARDESITAANAYSDLFLDSAAINTYAREKNLPDSTIQKLKNFYMVRNYQYAWFASNGPTEPTRGLWSLDAGSNDSAVDDSTALLQERMDSLLQGDSTRISAGDRGMLETELALTQRLMRYASSHPEHINPRTIYYLVPAKKQNPMELADSLINKQKGADLNASNIQYGQLKTQLKTYYDIAKNGGWTSIPAVKNLKKGVSHPAITAIKKRLNATGEYSGTDTTAVY
ncbi:MAG: L,D-transpeptidase scaffold domain-containing protein, partial [Flavisolibacter sp.]